MIKYSYILQQFPALLSKINYINTVTKVASINQHCCLISIRNYDHTTIGFHEKDDKGGFGKGVSNLYIKIKYSVLYFLIIYL